MKFRGYEIASETIFGPMQCFSEARQQSFTCTLSAYCITQNWFQPSGRLLTLQPHAPFGDETCKTIIVHLKEWKVIGRKTQIFFALFGASSEISTCHLCGWGPCMSICRAKALIGDAKHAMGEGKSGPVETGLTGSVTTALPKEKCFK